MNACSADGVLCASLALLVHTMEVLFTGYCHQRMMWSQTLTAGLPRQRRARLRVHPATRLPKRKCYLLLFDTMPLVPSHRLSVVFEKAVSSHAQQLLRQRRPRHASCRAGRKAVRKLPKARGAGSKETRGLKAPLQGAF